MAVVSYTTLPKCNFMLINALLTSNVLDMHSARAHMKSTIASVAPCRTAILSIT